MSFIIKNLQKLDLFGENPVEILNFNQKRENKSAIGGVCTIIIIGLVLFVFGVSFMPIYEKRYPLL